MGESIFSRLFHYRERENLSPRENYLTEMLAWMIDSLPQFGRDYIIFLCEKCNAYLITATSQLIDVSAQTQVSVTAGFIDMVIIADKKIGFICEHKVDSSLSENQIKKYYDCRAEIDDSLTDSFLTVLLTKNTEQHEDGTKADINLIWHDVYEYFSEKINKGMYDCKAEEKIIIEQFLMYLTEEGMGMKETINANAVAYYCDAMKLETVLKSILNDICTDKSLDNKCLGIGGFLKDYRPKEIGRAHV